MWRILGLALLVSLSLAPVGCSRFKLAYNTADFFAKEYASDYLGLAEEQLSSWEPRLELELERHRAEELPQLAAFFDRMLRASRSGLQPADMPCLTKGFRTLYKDHARLAIRLASPLLATLSPAQVAALEKRFRDEAKEDQEDLAKRDLAWVKVKRARRYAKSIENWTGALREDQKKIVGAVTDRMPDAEPEVAAYRKRKRQELIKLIRAGAGEREISGFMTAWLVDFQDLPPGLSKAGDEIEARVSELAVRLGASLDEAQKTQFQSRLQRMRDDLLQLQKEPRMSPSPC